MSRKSRYSPEEKIKACIDYLSGTASASDIAIRLCMGKRGCEFEREGYQGEEYCMECGQLVWVGGYDGENIKDNVVEFK